MLSIQLHSHTVRLPPIRPRIPEAMDTRGRIPIVNHYIVPLTIMRNILMWRWLARSHLSRVLLFKLHV
jgi:hypothetical protein